MLSECMNPAVMSDFLLAALYSGLLGAMLGAFLWSFVRDGAYYLTRWVNKRAKPPTPAQLLGAAAAMRKRSSQIVMQAERLRVSTLPK